MHCSSWLQNDLRGSHGKLWFCSSHSLQKTLKYTPNLQHAIQFEYTFPVVRYRMQLVLINQHSPKLFKVNLGGSRPEWHWMQILGVGHSVPSPPLFPLPSFSLPWVPSLYQLEPPINTCQHRHWYAGLENWVVPTQQPFISIVALKHKTLIQ